MRPHSHASSRRAHAALFILKAALTQIVLNHPGRESCAAGRLPSGRRPAAGEASRRQRARAAASSSLISPEARRLRQSLLAAALPRVLACANLRSPRGGLVPAAGAGDWLSGRAPRSHRGGHWFDPSIAHSCKSRSEAPRTALILRKDGSFCRIGRNLGDRVPRLVPERGKQMPGERTGSAVRPV